MGKAPILMIKKTYPRKKVIIGGTNRQVGGEKEMKEIVGHFGL